MGKNILCDVRVTNYLVVRVPAGYRCTLSTWRSSTCSEQFCLHAYPGLQKAQDHGKKHKKRLILGSSLDRTEEASSSGVPPVGETTGGPFLLASTVQSGKRLTVAVDR
eukprot:4963250-Amphidinium_carterae.1